MEARDLHRRVSVHVARLIDALGSPRSVDNARQATVELCRRRLEREEVDRELERHAARRREAVRRHDDWPASRRA